jgi:septum formation topological specificity factor MinE
MWCSSLQHILEGHPLKPSIDSSQMERLRKLILSVIGQYNQSTDSEIALFGDYLMQRMQSDINLNIRSQLVFPDPNGQARCSLLGRECNDILDQKCFIPVGIDLDIQVEDLKQIADLVALLKKVGLRVRYKKQSQKYGPRSVEVVSVLVTAHDILSGCHATVKVDFVLVTHPVLFNLDFDINGFRLILGPNKHFPDDMTLMHSQVYS